MLILPIIIYSTANTDVMNVHRGEVRLWSFRSSNSCSITDCGSTVNSCLLHFAIYLKWGQEKGVSGQRERCITVEVTSSIESDILIKLRRKHLWKLYLCQICLDISTQQWSMLKKKKEKAGNSCNKWYYFSHSDRTLASVNPIAQCFMVKVVSYSQSNGTRNTSKALQGISMFPSAILTCTPVKYGQL